MTTFNLYDEAQGTYDLYGETTSSTNYANNPVASPTLAVLLGSENGTTEGLHQQIMTMGPAYVAAERARLVRMDNLQLLRDATANLAKYNNVSAVQEGLNQIKELEKIKEPSFFDDVRDSSEDVIERVMISSGKPRDEVIRMANLYKENLALKTSLEVAASGIEPRSELTQFARDLTGLTTTYDWFRVSPVLNEELEKLGYKGNRALTFQGSVSNLKELLQITSENDRNKIIATLSKNLASRIGEQDTLRYFNALKTNISDSTLEVMFGSLDMLMVGAIASATVKTIARATKPLVVARKIGAEDAATKSIADQISTGSNNLSVSTVEAMDNAISARTLLPKELEGTSSAVQTELKSRLEKTIKDLDNNLYTGGAKTEEIIASKERLERIYSKEHNPSIVTSKVSADISSAKLNIDVLYGDFYGKPFATKEDALNYYKNTKRGDLEVVPVSGVSSEIKAATAEIDGELLTLNNKLFEEKFSPRLSTSGKVSEINDKYRLFNLPTGYTDRTEALISKSKITVEEAWNTIYRQNALPREQFVVDKLLKLLPKQTKVIVESKAGRSYYLPATDTLHVFEGEKATNVFTHELIHAITANRIEFGKLNPSSELGKVVSRLDELRQTVRKSAFKLKDEDLKKDIYYLTKNTHEFATSGMWSINQLPKVAAFFDSIKYKNTTILSALWNEFKQLLGFGTKDTALSEWFGLNEELTKQGLRVRLPEQVSTMEGKIVKITDRERIYNPYLPNEKVDDLLKSYETTVAKKLELGAPPEAEGYYLRQKTDMPVFAGDIGKISQDELDKMHLFLGKLNPRLSSVNSIYGPALTSMFKRTKHSKIYSEFTKDSFNKLNSTEIAKVNEALIQTETLKRDMTVFELGENGLRTDKEIEAYYSFRTMRNLQWYYKNKEAANELISLGYNDVFIGLEELGQFTGPAKKINLEDVLYKNIYDVELNKTITVTLDNIKELDARGIQIYEYAKKQNIQGRKGSITLVGTIPEKVRVGDINNVVGRLDGAYSRIYTEDYFIKINGPQLINDVYENVSYAFRTAMTETDAKKYTEGFNELLNSRKKGNIISDVDVSKQLGSFEQNGKELALRINNGEFDGAKATFNYSRLDDNFFRDVIGIGSGTTEKGKLFWSGRTEEGIQSITHGSTRLETKGPLDSLVAEISNTSRFTAINEWRRTSIQRWYNTFEDVISSVDKKGAKSAEDVFFNVVNNTKGYALSDSKPRQMLATKDFIMNQLGAKTTDEKIIQHAINQLTGSINVPGFAHVGKVLRQTDVINWAKSVNSSLMLGMFSVAQLAVQSSGMLLAASISPKHGLKAAYSIRPILSALTSDNKSVWKFIHKSLDVSMHSGMSLSEFSEVAQAIKRVGLLDNIGASSLYNGADGALNIFSRNKEKFNQAQMMFFNKGEEINRIGAFEIARREFIELNPNVKWNTDEALQKIVLRADDLSMNMTSANEARISKGVMGIPLQFLQHNIRLGTNLAAQIGTVTGKKSPTLSTSDAIKLTLGSYLLYGINNNATPDFIEEWLGNKLNAQLSETQKQYLTQGALAGIISTIGETITGERLNLAIGARLSSLQWYEDVGTAIYNIFKGESTDLKKLAGPTGSTLAAVLELPSIFMDYKHKDEWTISDFSTILSTGAATMISSWRNIDKAYWAYHANGMLLNKRGDPLANLSKGELIAQAMGFQSTEAYESNTVFATKKEYAATMQQYADSIMRKEALARKAYLQGDVAGMQRFYDEASLVLSPLPIADQQFIRRLIKDNTSYDTVGREAFNKWWATLSSHKNKLLVTSPFGE